MLCPKCGFYSEREENICPECGKILSPMNEETGNGIEAIRQGKRAREEAGKRPKHPAQEIPQQRSGASRAGEMPLVRDTRRNGDPELHVCACLADAPDGPG